MRPACLIVLFCLIAAVCSGQRTQRIMIAFHTDLIKSDHEGYFEKFQGGLEGSYYFSRKLAATAGLEWWRDDNKAIAVVGVRLAPIDEAFVRFRGLPGEDVSFGAGFAKPLSENLRIEAMADLYFKGHIAIRAGIAYGIGPKP